MAVVRMRVLMVGLTVFGVRVRPRVRVGVLELAVPMAVAGEGCEGRCGLLVYDAEASRARLTG